MLMTSHIWPYIKRDMTYEGNLWNSTLYEGGLVSQDLTWYTRNTINIGVDAEFSNAG